MNSLPHWHNEPSVLLKVILHALSKSYYGKQIKTVEELEAQIERINNAYKVLPRNMVPQDEDGKNMTFPRTIAECLSLSQRKQRWLHMLTERKWTDDPLEEEIAKALIRALFKVLPWMQNTQDLGVHRWIEELYVNKDRDNKSRVSSLTIIEDLKRKLADKEAEIAKLKKELAKSSYYDGEMARRNGWGSSITNPYLLRS